MKDGTTHLAYKPEHAVDLDTGVVVAAPIHPADEGDTTTLSPTLDAAARNLDAVGLAPSEEEPCVVVTDKGYHSREQLKALEGGVWKTRIAEPDPSKGYLRWHGDEAARKAVYANRVRLRSDIGRETMRRRGEMVERSFAHVLDRRGMRRAWLRGRENLHKRYLIHVAGFNLGVLMRALYGQGTPREAAETLYALIIVSQNRSGGGLRPDRHRRRRTRRNRHRRRRPDAKLKNREFVNGLLADGLARPISAGRDGLSREVSEPRGGNRKRLPPDRRGSRRVRHRHGRPDRLNRTRTNRPHLHHVDESEISVHPRHRRVCLGEVDCR